MRRRFGIIVSCMVLVGAISPANAYAKGWEPVKVEKITAPHVASDAELEIRAGGGVIYVNTSKHVNIKIFSILGSRIGEDSLAPGSYQFAVPTHGIYIIKAGDITCKVAV